MTEQLTYATTREEQRGDSCRCCLPTHLASNSQQQKTVSEREQLGAHLSLGQCSIVDEGQRQSEQRSVTGVGVTGMAVWILRTESEGGHAAALSGEAEGRRAERGEWEGQRSVVLLM